MAATPKPRKLASGQVIWRVQFRLTPGGKPTSETFDTIEGARQFAALVDKVGGLAARAARDSAQNAKTITSVNDLFDQHETATRVSADPGTVDKYRRIWDQHIGPELGFIPSEGLTREMVEEWLGRLRVKETRVSLARRGKDSSREPEYLSAKTIKNIHGLLSSVLKHAVQRGRLTANVAEGMKLPRGLKSIEPVFLSHSDFAILLNAVRVEHRPLVTFLAGTGLRWSEATALTGSDFQLDSSPFTVRVSKAWKSKENGELYIGTPKTARSERTVTLPASVVDMVGPLCEVAGPRGLVFTAPEGGPVRHSRFLENVWYPAKKAAGLARFPRIHDLRHTHASWLIASGVPLPVVQRRLGHESIKTTVDTYGHLAPDSYAGAAEAAELALVQALPLIEN